MSWVDHLVLPTADVDALEARLLAEHGLAAVPGGRHRGHGTANRIVPLGAAYLELVFVEDAEVADGSPFGMWVTRESAAGVRIAAVCLATDDIEAVAGRLGRRSVAMQRVRPDGVELVWRLVGIDDAVADGLPFFIQWDVPPAEHPGRARAAHRVQPVGVAWIELGGDADRIGEWIGPTDMDVRWVGGPPGIRRCGVATTAGEITL